MPLILGVPTLGPWELLIILLIIVAVFGASKIAGIGGAVGGSIREFKKAVREGEEDTPAATNSRIDGVEQSEQKSL
jgi:sec-independent protein translocase protein TatA